MASPRVCSSEISAGSMIETWTLSGASVWDSGASPSHSRRSPRRMALYVRIVIHPDRPSSHLSGKAVGLSLRVIEAIFPTHLVGKNLRFLTS